MTVGRKPELQNKLRELKVGEKFSWPPPPKSGRVLRDSINAAKRRAGLNISLEFEEAGDKVVVTRTA